ncbi:MAG TPA: hypothetical protein VLA54_14300 [Acidimicrobiia bacterium]|nr:hypothetical protein [Acidimicrobiia bacterium]
MNEALRPVERRMLALAQQGLDPVEIGRRFRRGPEHVERVIDWTRIPRQRPPQRHQGLRPVERRVLDLRAEGFSHQEIGELFRRGENYARRVETFARLRADLGLA